jgi:hypothetical protein
MLILPLLLLTASGCTPVHSSAPLVTIGLTGGMCPDNSCDRSFVVFEDGTTSEGETIALPALEAALENSRLTMLVEADEPYCPSFADGQDITIKVDAWGATTYKPCLLIRGEEDALTLEAISLLTQVYG